MARKLSTAWKWFVWFCVFVVACLLIAQFPALVYGPAKAIVWLAQKVAWVLGHA